MAGDHSGGMRDTGSALALWESIQVWWVEKEGLQVEAHGRVQVEVKATISCVVAEGWQ